MSKIPMPEEDYGINELIEQALSANEKMAKYLSYSPIVNSRDMLLGIKEISDKKDELSNNSGKLNVGLLAAKSLDFESTDSLLYEYGTVLHEVWAAVSKFINPNFILPPSDINQRKAYDFYNKNGYEHNRIMNHLSCIDFTKGVEVIGLSKNPIVGQWKIPSISQGDYYADLNNSVTPNCLGINDEQEDKNGHKSKRIEHKYELQIDAVDVVTVLKSIAAGVLDTWSVKSVSVPTNGGCIQYFNANDKCKFKQIFPQIRPGSLFNNP
ncbi:MAG: hypothetical protein K2X50_06260 [Gammaproteobacteria bacterium]|nr:hypothetical protein [Gammaproteobacteria bacterium]